MKIEFDKKLLKYSIYITITAVIIYVAFLIISNIGTLFKTTFDILDYLVNLIKPLLIAIIIAYLLYPVTRSIENFLEKNKIYKIQKCINKTCSSYYLFILFNNRYFFRITYVESII